MFRSSFRFLAVSALSVAAACATLTTTIVRASAAVLYVGYEWFMKVFIGPVDVRAETLQLPVAKALHRAAAFVARLLKRERPRMEAGWRMCPSI